MVFMVEDAGLIDSCLRDCGISGMLCELGACVCSE